MLPSVRSRMLAFMSVPRAGGGILEYGSVDVDAKTRQVLLGLAYVIPLVLV